MSQNANTDFGETLEQTVSKKPAIMIFPTILNLRSRLWPGGPRSRSDSGFLYSSWHYSRYQKVLFDRQTRTPSAFGSAECELRNIEGNPATPTGPCIRASQFELVSCFFIFRPHKFICVWGRKIIICVAFFFQILPNLHFLLHFIFNITFY